MPRKAAPGLPAAKAEIRKLKAKLKELTGDYEEESDLRAKAQFALNELRREVQRAKQAEPIAHLDSVNFDRTPPTDELPDELPDELANLYAMIKILDALEPFERYRLLSMLDARFYDPPVKAR